MKLNLFITALIATIVLPLAAQDLESQNAALEKENAELRIILDERQRKEAAADPLKIVQELQWGKGWAIDSALDPRDSAPFSLGIISPKISNLATIEVRGAYLQNNGFSVINGSAPMETYSATRGFRLGARLALWTPMFFNFTRGYLGLGGNYSALFPTNTVTGHKEYSFYPYILAGAEIHLVEWLTIFGEAGGVGVWNGFPSWHIPEGNYYYIYPTSITRIGLRVYLGK
ncbi:MAG: hypothetical protein WCQ50_00265 [Spirochaetota bacterium]